MGNDVLAGNADVNVAGELAVPWRRLHMRVRGLARGCRAFAIFACTDVVGRGRLQHGQGSQLLDAPRLAIAKSARTSRKRDAFDVNEVLAPAFATSVHDTLICQ